MALLGSLLRRPMELYKGLHIGCVPGTHARLVELVRRHLPPCAGVLDIGAHSGALLSRLQDAGYTDLTGADLDMTRFALDGARFIKVELNQPFSAAFDRKFRLIVSTDVIEHLDSPRNFLTEARKMLEEGGLLAISLPNVAFWEGRCKFLLKGELWGFGQENYRTQRHISPVTFEQMEMMMQEVGLRVLEATSAGSFATPLRRVLGFPLWGSLRLLGGPHTLGEAAIFVAQRDEPSADLKVPTHYRSRWQGIPDNL